MSTECSDFTRRRGFSMAELTLAALAMGMIMVPALDVLRSGVRGTAQSVQLTRAFQVGRAVVDAVHTCSGEQLDDSWLEGIVSGMALPDGVTSLRVDPIRLVTERGPDGWRYEAKVATVRVGWRKTEGGEKGEVVLHAMAVSVR